MHICFITHEYPNEDNRYGGIGVFVKTLANWIVNSGHKVSVIGINNKDQNQEENDQGVVIYRLKKQVKKGFTWWLHAQSINRKLEELHLEKPIDIVEGSELVFAFIQKIPGVKYLIRLHGGHHFFADSENRGINWWKGFQEKRSFKKADAIVGVSQYVVDHTSQYLSFDKKKRGVIFNPANLEKFYQADREQSVKGRIFFAGTVCEKKGIRQLIQAMPSIKKEVPEAHLWIAGRDWKFPKTGKSYIEYVKQFIEPSVKDSIVFLGSLPNQNIPNYIREAEVCCYPSQMESFGIAWVEVMSMGKLLIASNVGPGPEIIKQEENGLMCDPLDPKDIAEKVIFILKNPQEARRMGGNARAFAFQNFSLDTIGEKNIQLYQSLL